MAFQGYILCILSCIYKAFFLVFLMKIFLFSSFPDSRPPPRKIFEYKTQSGYILCISFISPPLPPLFPRFFNVIFLSCFLSPEKTWVYNPKSQELKDDANRQTVIYAPSTTIHSIETNLYYNIQPVRVFYSIGQNMSSLIL